MLITFYSREQVEKSQPLYWLNFYISPKDLTKVLTEWYTLLKHQSVFLTFIKQDNSVLHFPLLPQVQLSKFITILDNAVSLWKSSNDFLQAAIYYHPIATGISSTGLWCLRSLPNFKLYGDEIFLCAKVYCYLLRHTWTKLLASNDIVIGETALLKFSNFGVVPQRKQFDEVTRILQLAALEKQFDIEKRISIEVGKVGCQEIEFLPLQTDLKCLFKVVTHKHPQENLCLAGELDALKGSIAFAGTPQEESVQGHLRLLLFIVALAYKDLIVARDYISKKTIISCLPKSNKDQKHININCQQNSTRLILSFKSKIDNNFADLKQFIEQISRRLQ